MNRQDKIQFIESLCGSIMQEAIEMTAIMPDSWDGHELRRYLADKFEREAWSMKPTQRNRRRVANYRNDCATLNL